MNFGARSKEWNSEVYNRVSKPQFGWGQKVLERLRLKGTETVLDAGCGTGKLTAELLASLPQGRVIAVDLSENMLRSAREQLEPEFGKQVVLFAVADVLDLPFHEEVDGIFSTAAFHWVTDHERLFRSLYRALRPGGWLEAQCGGGPNLGVLPERVAALMRSPDFSKYFADWRPIWEFASPDTTAWRMKAAGFVEVDTGLEPTPVHFADAEEYREYVSHVIFHRHVERILEDKLRRKFVDELTRLASEGRSAVRRRLLAPESQRKTAPPVNPLGPCHHRSTVQALLAHAIVDPGEVLLAAILDRNLNTFRQVVRVHFANGGIHRVKTRRGGFDHQ